MGSLSKETLEQIHTLQSQVEAAKQQLNMKNLNIQKLKKAQSEPSSDQIVAEKLENLDAKEKELDRDAEIIATQSEELRKESERLLTERDEVRKQKEQWTAMIEEVKQTKSVLEAK